MANTYDLHDYVEESVITSVSSNKIADITGMDVVKVSRYARTGYLYNCRYRIFKSANNKNELMRKINNGTERNYTSEYVEDFTRQWNETTEQLKSSGKIASIRLVAQGVIIAE
ncbi:hypothetical protein [Lachnoclostridium sp.]|uniref:hypothetical protein n=1 Tax=Lachnoclostridium sp. TaxID=2028282 RepID=UPI0028973C52|nr:hypothetical protein [Lachnoclostridium sp.]